MKLVAMLFVLLSANAGAEVLKCDFTEPFFNIEFDSATKVVTYTGVDTYDETTGTFNEVILAEGAKIVETTTSGPVIGSEFSLVNQEGKEILKLALTFRGSNGMSDHVYPFDVWYGQFWGGCETTTAQAVDTFELLDNLQN